MTNAIPTLDPIADLVACQDVMRRHNWWGKAGVAEQWPLTTAQAARLLQLAGEFEVDEFSLEAFVDRGLMAAPGRGETGDYEWLATDICTAAGHLETRRQWLAFSSLHDHKKSVCELILEQARADGKLGDVINGGPQRFDVRELLTLLTQCPTPEGRHKTAVLLRAVLEHEYDVPI